MSSENDSVKDVCTYSRSVSPDEADKVFKRVSELVKSREGVFPGCHPVLAEETDIDSILCASEPRMWMTAIDCATPRSIVAFLEMESKTKVYMITTDCKVHTVKCGKFPFFMFKGTILDGLVVEDGESRSPEFVVHDILTLSGRDVCRNGFSSRCNIVEKICNEYATSNTYKKSFNLDFKKADYQKVHAHFSRDQVKQLMNNDAVLFKASSHKYRIQGCGKNFLYLPTTALKFIKAGMKNPEKEKQITPEIDVEWQMMEENIFVIID